MTTKRRRSTPADNPPTEARTDTLFRGVDLVSPARSAQPQLPHERDEATGATGGAPDAKVQQGHRDVVRGVQDTSRAPEAGRAYDKLKKG